MERSALLGTMEANYFLGGIDYLGQEVEMDMDKAVRHMEAAAISGDRDANFDLALLEHQRGNNDRSVELCVTAT